MAILAIVGGIVAPRYTSSLTHQKAEAAARRIAADLSYAQRRARFSSSAQTVTFDLQAHAYSGAGLSVRLADDPYQAMILEAKFGDEDHVAFDGFGVPSNGGTIVIQVGNREKTIMLDGDSGRVTIK